MKFIKKIEHVFNFVEMWFLACSLAVMAVILIIQVVWRYFLNSPLVWSEELARYVFLWITFLGISFGLRNNAHIAVEMLVNAFPEKIRKLVIVFNYLVVMALFLYLLGPAWRFSHKMWNIASPGMGLSMGLIYLALPIGFLTACVRIIFQVIDLVVDRKEVSGS